MSYIALLILFFVWLLGIGLFAVFAEALDRWVNREIEEEVNDGRE